MIAYLLHLSSICLWIYVGFILKTYINSQAILFPSEYNSLDNNESKIQIAKRRTRPSSVIKMDIINTVELLLSKVHVQEYGYNIPTKFIYLLDELSLELLESHEEELQYLEKQNG